MEPDRRHSRADRPRHRAQRRHRGLERCRMTTPDIPNLPTDVMAAMRRAAMPDFPRFREMVNATGGCAQPIRLKGERTTVDAETGEIIETYSTADEPTGYLLTSCGNRRASRCPACAEVYRDDTYHLIISGMQGGKGV